MNTTNRKLKFGKVDQLPNEPFNPRQIKVRISIMLDGDVLQAARRLSSKQRLRYQTFINRVLRQALLGQTETTEIDSIERRVAALEEIITLINRPDQNGSGKRKVA